MAAVSVQQTVENIYLRQEAVQLTRRHFWHLLGMRLVIFLLIGALDWLLTALGDMITLPEATAAVTAINHFAISQNISSATRMTQSLSQLLTSPKFLLFNLFYAIVLGIMNSALSLGYCTQLIAAGHGVAPKVRGCFSMMRRCLKAWGLNLYAALRIILWAMPGLAVIIIGDELTLYGVNSLGTIVIFAGIALMISLAIAAAFNYSMASFILADNPTRGIRECVTFSTGLMKKRRWQFFKLGIPMYLKAIGVLYCMMLVLSLVLNLLDATNHIASVIIMILALLALLAAILYFSLQLDLVSALFYLKRREPIAEAPVSYWLRDPKPVAPTSAPVEDSPEESSEDITPHTNAKENSHDEPES